MRLFARKKTPQRDLSIGLLVNCLFDLLVRIECGRVYCFVFAIFRRQ